MSFLTSTVCISARVASFYIPIAIYELAKGGHRYPAILMGGVLGVLIGIGWSETSKS